MDEGALLLWARGTGFQIAFFIFCVGIVLRLVEILLLGRKPNYAEARGNPVEGGLRTIVSRSWVYQGTFARSKLTILLGYVFHLGIFFILLLFIPHIAFFAEILGFSWAGLPSPLIDFISVLTLLALLGVLIHRLQDKVLRFLSTRMDYIVWLVTFLPVLTGYLAYHHLFFSYQLILALHLLSVQLLMILFPFTKLMHAFSLFIARFYNGADAARKGVEA
ncbi:hypothetical protein AL038_04725 [Beggiatoa leptomitoformis]|uniref:Nitrate reductase n=2 Tax=Beggiatoa leptomitoformis TaxID=288004 RepID=A0A2N9YAG6_9GAMM|nr:hypothetical protein AL038_04725 [Beggiatoa leptomitoformis]AUI67458.2 hypothetical protein BLE401_01275 [Beggiatoa leptomitoformis]